MNRLEFYGRNARSNAISIENVSSQLYLQSPSPSTVSGSFSQCISSSTLQLREDEREQHYTRLPKDLDTLHQRQRQSPYWTLAQHKPNR